MIPFESLFAARYCFLYDLQSFWLHSLPKLKLFLKTAMKIFRFAANF